MTDHIKANVLWTIWGSLLFYYFYFPYKALGRIPFTPQMRDFKWDWVITFSCIHIPLIALLWVISQRKKGKKKMLGYFIAGVAIANANCNYASFLVDQEKYANQTVVWVIGLLGMLAFCPFFLKPKDAEKTRIASA